MTAIHQPAFAHAIPEDVKQTVHNNRTMAEIIADLGRQHDEHVASLAAHAAACEEQIARIDALLKENGK